MNDTVVTVENLSKRYLVGHRTAQRERYIALRDVIGRNARQMARRAVELLRGRQMIDGDEVEEFWALKDVSFEVKCGQVLGIVGRNGAGKSTLLKIMSRITEPTDGRVILRGRIGSLLEVGTGFHPELTGRENIFLNGAVLGMKRSEIRRRFDEIVAFSEVERFLDTPVKRYSSGMYVRLAFAVAAHLDPEILIVDEVLAVGDAAFQKKCLGKMHDVTTQQGRTVLFVSHNISSLRALCSQGVLLRDGRVTGCGKIEDVISLYGSDEPLSSSKYYPEPSIVRRVSAIQQADGIIIELEYSDIRGKLTIPGLSFVIHDIEGHAIFGHNPMLEQRHLQDKCPHEGLVRATITSPKLLDGNYTISIFLGDPYTTIFRDPNCLTISIVGLVSSNYQLPAAQVGSVFPECQYEFVS